MKYTVLPDSGEKAYLQIYRQLRDDIIAGVFSYGTKLPSKRLLASETGVSVITVEHAFALLLDEGYCESRERSGYYVIYRDCDFLSAGKEESLPPATPATSSHPTPQSSISFGILARAMRKVLLEKGERILQKSPNHGCPELRGAIVSYLARSQGIHVLPEQIIIGSGAEYLYDLIAQLFFGRRFALEDPSYDKIRRVYCACGIECEMLPLNIDGIRSENLRESKATILHITPFNSFPSGITASASKRAEYIRWSEEREGFIIEDNYDSEMSVSTKNESTVFSLSKSGRVIYLNTFSKTIAPSLRAGYMVLPQRLCADFEKRLGFYSCTVPLFEQFVLAELLNSGDFERHINRVRRMKRKELEKRI